MGSMRLPKDPLCKRTEGQTILPCFAFQKGLCGHRELWLGAGHRFRKQANNLYAYEQIAAFLDAHLK